MYDENEVARLQWEADMQRQVDSRKAWWRDFRFWFAIFALVSVMVGAVLWDD